MHLALTPVVIGTEYTDRRVALQLGSFSTEHSFLEWQQHVDNCFYKYCSKTVFLAVQKAHRLAFPSLSTSPPAVASKGPLPDSRNRTTVPATSSYLLLRVHSQKQPYSGYVAFVRSSPEPNFPLTQAGTVHHESNSRLLNREDMSLRLCLKTYHSCPGRTDPKSTPQEG